MTITLNDDEVRWLMETVITDVAATRRVVEQCPDLDEARESLKCGRELLIKMSLQIITQNETDDAGMAIKPELN
tara:strand:- start:74 stop:295 length:222 start_codon:yes stop_codon:yes gene_type:complete